MYAIRSYYGIAKIYGIAYLKYVLAGDAIHTSTSDTTGAKYIKYLYFLSFIKITNMYIYNQTLNPILTIIPSIGR